MTRYAQGALVPLAQSTADVSIVNSTAETNLLSVAIPPSLLAGDVIRLRLAGDLLNNSGGSVNYTFKVYVGATAILSTGAVGLSANAARRRWFIDADIVLLTTASERAMGRIIVGPQSGTSMAPATSSVVGPGYGTATEDVTASKNLLMSITLGTADANADCFLHVATVEVIKAGPVG